MLSRRQISVAGLTTLGWPSAAIGSEAPRTRPPVLIVQTFLQARQDRRRELGRFIELNWLVMDRQAIDQGLFSHATLLEVVGADGSEAADRVDYIVEVGYLTPGGYGDVSGRFNEIRARHRTLPVDGFLMADLGRVVGDQQLRPVASS